MTDETTGLEQQAFSIPEFCVRNRICGSTFHKLKNAGQGPRIMYVGSAQRISIEAERDWRAARERPSPAEARRLEVEATQRREKTKAMARRAVASPEHVSKRNVKR